MNGFRSAVRDRGTHRLREQARSHRFDCVHSVRNGASVRPPSLASQLPQVFVAWTGIGQHPTSNVGESRLAMAAGQAAMCCRGRRYREQARSHRFDCVHSVRNGPSVRPPSLASQLPQVFVAWTGIGQHPTSNAGLLSTEKQKQRPDQKIAAFGSSYSWIAFRSRTGRLSGRLREQARSHRKAKANQAGRPATQHDERKLE